ncbi:MAG: hydrolase, TatD family [Cyanobacteria bacterium RYN_339]|nr:hydrolase, TatD family [Cyanobacteria bacterium RYN_339]
MLELVDSHCHLDVEQFDQDRAAMIERAFTAGVRAMVVPGIRMPDMPRVLALAEGYPQIYIGVGVHPHEAHNWTPDDAATLREWAKHPKVVAIGEIGLDHYYPEPPRDVQHRVMVEQVRLAGELGKPIIVHDRDAHGEVFDLMKAHLDPQAGGVMHCFSGSYEFALECIKLGLVISFAGSVTFKNAHNLQEAAAKLPLDKILIETDSPYLAPVPHRGKRNEPSNVAEVARKLAELQGVPVEEVARITSANARRLFRLPS